MTNHRAARRHPLARFKVPLALLAVLAVGLGVGYVLRGPAEVPVAVPNPPVPATPVTSAPVTSAPATISPRATPASPVTAFGDGAFYVSTVGSAQGVTVAPGTYRSAGVAGCAWEKRDGSDGVRGSIDQIVLRPGNFIRSQGCGAWTKVR